MEEILEINDKVLELLKDGKLDESIKIVESLDQYGLSRVALHLIDNFLVEDEEYVFTESVQSMFNTSINLMDTTKLIRESIDILNEEGYGDKEYPKRVTREDYEKYDRDFYNDRCHIISLKVVEISNK